MRSRTPKVLHDVCGRPMIDWPVAAAREAGAGRIVVVDAPDRALDGRLPEGVDDRCAGRSPTAPAAPSPRRSTRSPTARRSLVLNGDVPLVTPEASARSSRPTPPPAPRRRSSRRSSTTRAGYGRVVRDADGGVERIVETKRRATRRRGARDPRDQLRRLRLRRRRADGRAAAASAPTTRRASSTCPTSCRCSAPAAARSPRTSSTTRRCCSASTTASSSRASARSPRRRIIEAHLRAGVDVVDPESTVIDVGVADRRRHRRRAVDVLRGTTRDRSAADRARARRCSTRRSATSARSCTPTSSDREVRDGASVGPFAYLRPGTLLRERSKVGTFVEVKNSDIGEGTKVPHLSYIGDADVGPGTNLGAATITANYDGRTSTARRSARACAAASTPPTSRR